MQQALLLIDIQNDYFADGLMPLVNPEAALKNTAKILADFRNEGLAVIHVQHINAHPEATFFLPDTEGVKIHPELEPLPNEPVVTKHAPNGFFETTLLDLLCQNDISELVVCGMMSHMCIDTTVRAAKDYGFKVTLLFDACATKDLFFENQIVPAETVHRTFMAALNGMFAEVIHTTDFSLSK